MRRSLRNKIIEMSSIPKDDLFELYFKRKLYVLKNQKEFDEYIAAKLLVHYRKVVLMDEKRWTRATKEEIADVISYTTAEWKFARQLRYVEQAELQPLCAELIEAASLPQYDWHYIYDLEYHKLRNVLVYLSHSRIADECGHFHGKRYLEIAIHLLDAIRHGGDEQYISREQVNKMNTANIAISLSNNDLQAYKKAKENGNQEEIYYYGRQLYLRKMEHLYHLIRISHTHDWWE